MALINLLPTAAKKPKHIEKISKGVSSTKALENISLNKPIIITAVVFVIIIIALFALVKTKERLLYSLNKKTGEIKSEYQKIEEQKKIVAELNDTLSFLANAAKTEILWSEKLDLIDKTILSQIWLTSISVESSQIKTDASKTKTIKTLVINGSATSLIDSEIISAVMQFVEQLKKNNAFSKDFQEIKLGPLQSNKKGSLSVMDFTVYCKFNN